MIIYNLAELNRLQPLVSAKPNSRVVRFCNCYHIFNIEVEDENDRFARKVAKEYMKKLREKKRRINNLFVDYTVVPQYLDGQVSEIILIMNELEDEPPHVIASEICKRLNL